MNTIDSVMERHYYTNADSALQVLNHLYRQYSNNGSTEACMYVLLNKTYVAEHHYLIDSLDVYLQKADSFLGKNVHSGFVNDFKYMKGMYNYYMGDYDRAIEDFKSMIFEDGNLIIADSMQTYNSLFNLGQLSVYHQDYASAQQYYQLAKKILPVQSDTYASIRDYRYEQSFLQMSMAKATFYRIKNVDDPSQLAPIAYSFERAIQRIADKEGKAGADNLFITMYISLSEVYISMNELQKANTIILKAIPLSKGSDPERQLKLYFEMAHLQVRMKKFEQAENYLKKADSLISKNVKGKYRFLAKRYYETGNMLSMQKKYKAAINEYQKSLSELIYNNDNRLKMDDQIPLDSIVAENEVLKVLLSKAETLAEWYKISQDKPESIVASIETYEKAFQVIDKIRTGFQNEESKLFLSSTMSSAFEKSIDACYAAYKNSGNSKFLKKAFQFAEQNKTNQLLEMVKGLTSKSFSHLPSKLIEEERRLKGRIFYWKEAVLNADHRNEETYQKLLESQVKYENFIAKLEKEYPEYYRLKYNQGSLGVEEIQKNILDGNTALIEYFFGQDHLYVFGINQGSLIMVSVNSDANFNEGILNFLRALKSHNSEGFEGHANYLYKKLFQPLQKILPKKNGKLIIIPDGPLGYLPFEALKILQANDSRYLIQDFSINYDYSARLFKEKPKLTNRDVKYAYVGFAPSYEASPATLNRKANIALKFNRDEVINARDQMGGQAFINEHATEDNFYKYAENSGLLHLSMHAIVDDKHPSRSAFYFVEERKKDSLNSNKVFEADGSLHVYEIYNLLLKADLAVLSACETGSGEIMEGEGIMSMGRAFQYAGCPSVVMSLWRINDKSTASIMEDFFKNLNKGLNKDEALRQAKLNFLNQPENKFFSHPYYWSAFIFMGDPQPITSPINSGFIVLGTLSIGILLTLLVVYRNRTGKNST